MLCTQDRIAVSLDAARHRHIKSVHIYVDVVMLKQVEQQRTKKMKKKTVVFVIVVIAFLECEAPTLSPESRLESCFVM